MKKREGKSLIHLSCEKGLPTRNTMLTEARTCGPGLLSLDLHKLFEIANPKKILQHS